MPSLVTTPEQVSAEWLTNALRESGHLGSGRVSAVSHNIIGTGKMGDNARLELSYEGDQGRAPITAVAKFPAQDETARAIAGLQGAYYAEVMFYRLLAYKTSMRTPLIYINEVSEDRINFITVMEDMSPAEPGSQLVGASKQQTRVAMKEAAKLAAAFYGDDSIGDYDFVMTTAKDDGGQQGFDYLTQSWPIFLERFGDKLSDECKEFCDFYIKNHCTFVTRFKGTKTLVHGDFRSENILFNGDKACTVDWQTTCLSSPVADFSYFMGGSVDTEDRRAWEHELVAEYAQELKQLGVELSKEECWNQYREQTMHGLMITILGASFSEAEERSDAMFTAMIQRHLQHCVDLDAAEFLR